MGEIAEAIIDGELCPLCACTREDCDCSPEAVKSAGGHIFVAQRANYRRDREVKWFEQILKLGAKVDQRNSGSHWIITRGQKRWDFWPSRQKYKSPSGNGILRGFEDMFQEIRS